LTEINYTEAFVNRIIVFQNPRHVSVFERQNRYSASLNLIPFAATTWRGYSDMPLAVLARSVSAGRSARGVPSQHGCL